MFNADNNPEISRPMERSSNIEGYIKKTAIEYQQGNFHEVIASLSDGNDQCLEFTDKHDLQIQHGRIVLNFDNLTEIGDPKYLPTIITQVLTHGHGWSSTSMETPDDIAIYSDNERVEDIKLPPLWEKIMALCMLEEWVHVLDHSKHEEAGTEEPSNDEAENNVALYLHNQLGIKLPKYFLEQYGRKELNLPIEDHDFDEVDL